MAKIDVSKIEGYADMSAEDKIKALEAAELPDPDLSGMVKKEVFDKTASELADWKKKHNALLSAEEKKKQEDEEALTNMKNELETLKKDKTIATYKANYIAQGYDDALATETATALVDGDTEKVFANQKKFLENYAKTVKADVLKQTPKPPAGNGGAANTDFDKQIAEANARGDFASVAALLRLQQEAEK